MMYRISIIGAGGIAEVHAMAYEYIEQVKIAAVVDSDLNRAQEMAGKYNANWYGTYEDMISKEDIDIIDICLPSYLHKEYIVKALGHNKHVICEKPLALSEEDAKAVITAKECCKSKLMIAHCLRFADEYNYLKQVIEKDTYGRLLHIDFYRNVAMTKEKENTWLFDQKKSGGILFDLHIHDVDILYYLLGSPQKHTTYKTKRFVNSIFKYDGLTISIASSWRIQKSYEFSAGYEAFFENATLKYENGKIEIHTDEKRENVMLPNKNEIVKENYIKMYYNEILYFIKCLESDIEPLQCSPSDNFESLKLILGSM